MVVVSSIHHTTTIEWTFTYNSIYYINLFYYYDGSSSTTTVWTTGKNGHKLCGNCTQISIHYWAINLGQLTCCQIMRIHIRWHIRCHSPPPLLSLFYEVNCPPSTSIHSITQPNIQFQIEIQSKVSNGIQNQNKNKKKKNKTTQQGFVVQSPMMMGNIFNWILPPITSQSNRNVASM